MQSIPRVKAKLTSIQTRKRQDYATNERQGSRRSRKESLAEDEGSQELLKKMKRTMKNEMRLLRKLDHPNVIRILETYQGKGDAFFIVISLCTGGDLRSRMPFSESTAARITMQVLRGLSHLHAQGVCHRDLKPENIMFENMSSKAQVVLIDFGISLKLSPDSKSYHNWVGTGYTSAPEVLGVGGYTTQVCI